MAIVFIGVVSVILPVAVIAPIYVVMHQEEPVEILDGPRPSA